LEGSLVRDEGRGFVTSGDIRGVRESRGLGVKKVWRGGGGPLKSKKSFQKKKAGNKT